MRLIGKLFQSKGFEQKLLKMRLLTVSKILIVFEKYKYKYFKLGV